ncbi:MAG: CHASE2 domain-containing protein [Rhodospirillales bacterium]|nr:CHASE2 domain-containing protein [Rhodospirillales bacterium]
MNLFQPVNTKALHDSKRSRWPHAVVFVLVALAYGLGGLDGLEHKLMDLRFRVSDSPVSSDSVLVGIDSQSIREFRQWPWRRSLHAQLIRRLTAAGARRIVLDIDLSSSSSHAEDADLAAAIRDAGGRVVLPIFKQRTMSGTKAFTYTEPLAMFRDHAQTASVNIQTESDSLVRRYNRVESWQETFVPALATQLAGLMPVFFEPFYVDYGIRPQSVPYFSYADVYRDQFSADAVKGRTVFIGAVAVELGDMLSVPVHGSLAGPMVQILAYESIKTGRTIERSPASLSLIAALLLALFLGPRISAWSWKWGLLTTLGLGGLSFAGAAGLQVFAPVSADISPLLLVLSLSYIWSLIQKIDIQSLGLFKQHMAAVHTRALMSSVVGESFDGIIITKPDGEILFVNPAACNLLERRTNDIEGQNISRFLQTDDDSAYEAKSRDVSGSEAQVIAKSRLSEVKARSGVRVPVEYSATIVPLVLGQSAFEIRTDNRSAYIYTLRDVRESQKAEMAMQTAADKAIAADHAKTELLANVSHELRTPLNAVIGFSTCMDNEMFGPLGHEKYKEYAHDILYSGQHLLEMVENILTISRVDSNNYTLVEENLDLGALVHDCVNIVKGTADLNQVTLEADLPDDLPKLYADSKTLKQILLNLLGNAVKFTGAEGTVCTSVRFAPSGELVLTVADNGIGIAQDDVQRIIKPFEQVEGAMSRTHGGAGLGLHIVSGLVELHGAQLQIQSKLGIGTKVSVRFPRERVAGYDNVFSIVDQTSRRLD